MFEVATLMGLEFIFLNIGHFLAQGSDSVSRDKAFSSSGSFCSISGSIYVGNLFSVGTTCHELVLDRFNQL